MKIPGRRCSPIWENNALSSIRFVRAIRVSECRCLGRRVPRFRVIRILQSDQLLALSAKRQIAGSPHLDQSSADFWRRLRTIGIVVMVKLNQITPGSSLHGLSELDCSAHPKPVHAYLLIVTSLFGITYPIRAVFQVKSRAECPILAPRIDRRNTVR